MNPLDALRLRIAERILTLLAEADKLLAALHELS